MGSKSVIILYSNAYISIFSANYIKNLFQDDSLTSVQADDEEIVNILVSFCNSSARFDRLIRKLVEDEEFFNRILKEISENKEKLQDSMKTITGSHFPNIDAIFPLFINKLQNVPEYIADLHIELQKLKYISFKAFERSWWYITPRLWPAVPLALHYRTPDLITITSGCASKSLSSLYKNGKLSPANKARGIIIDYESSFLCPGTSDGDAISPEVLQSMT